MKEAHRIELFCAAVSNTAVWQQLLEVLSRGICPDPIPDRESFVSREQRVW